MRVVDLSLPLDNNAAWAPWWMRTNVRRFGHRLGRLAMRLLFGISRRQLATGLGWANETLALSTHGTTHLDAPWHYGPTCEGQPAKTIDRIPLAWCYANGVVLDLRHKPDGEAIAVDDLTTALHRIRYAIRPMDIVLIHTGNDRFFGTPDYFTRGSGMSAAATRFILDHGVKVTGIDSWTWDAPLSAAARHVKRQGRAGATFWEAHHVGVEKEYCHLEQLTNLAALPPTGFTVCCFPLKVAGGSAGPARVVAMIGDETRR